MKVVIDIVNKCSDSDFTVLDITSCDPDSAFQLGEIFHDLFVNHSSDVLRIDGHGIRVILHERKAAPQENAETVNTCTQHGQPETSTHQA